MVNVPTQKILFQLTPDDNTKNIKNHISEFILNILFFKHPMSVTVGISL